MVPGNILVISYAVILTSMTITAFLDSATVFEKAAAGEAHTGNDDVLQEERALPTYIIRMMPGANEDDPSHYNPHNVAVPSGIMVEWINNDQGILHTVTSGNPSDEDFGSLFNSGPMPFRQDFKLTFDRVGGLVGEFPYYCKIHPWITGTVSANDTVVKGENFEMAAGTGPVLNLTENSRTLLEFRPIGLSVPRDSVLSYNFTIVRNDDDNKTVFGDEFEVEDNDFEVEIVQTPELNQGAPVVVYGPDVSTEYTGAYHVAGDIVEPGNYTLVTEITRIGLHSPLEQIRDEFQMQVVS